MRPFRTLAAVLAALAIIRGWQRANAATRPVDLRRCANCPQRTDRPRSVP